MKKCPKCAEEVQDEAKVCRFCGYTFSALERTFGSSKQGGSGAGIGCLVIIGLVVAIGMCSPGGDGNQAGSDPAAASESEAEKKRKGFHCLSAWDGSHREIVAALKKTLRDPGSFEHVETRITPVNDKGEHVLMMDYRARNGFGGMNVGELAATVRNSDCGFTIVAAADE